MNILSIKLSTVEKKLIFRSKKLNFKKSSNEPILMKFETLNYLYKRQNTAVKNENLKKVIKDEISELNSFKSFFKNLK